MADTVQKGNKIKVHYTGTFEDGTEFDSSKGKEPLMFEAGAGQVVKGFDEAVLGMKVGEKKKFTLAPEEAYGPVHDELKKEFPRDKLPEDMTPKVGDMLPLQAPTGQVYPAKVLEVRDDNLLLDLNHPLAGKTLVFEIELVGIEA